jgi:glycosyltransferase involved in cell wall biosynthesis
MPLVSIWITAYNHVDYIRQALDSVLMQKTGFDYEIVLGEDCSTDGTRDIVLQYKEKYPDKFRLFLPEQNLGMLPMFRETYALLTGKYIAWLDGDDFWTDPDKLQKQVDFLESHPDYVMCFHKATDVNQILNTEKESLDPDNMLPGATLTSEQFLHIRNPVRSSSVLHRNVLERTLPEAFYSIPYSDWAFYFLLLKHGKAKYMDDNMSVYRIHGGGSWSGQPEKLKYYSMIEFYKQLQAFFPWLPEEKTRQLISNHYKRVLRLELKDKSIKGVLFDLKEIIRYDRELLKRFGRLKFITGAGKKNQP